MEQAGLGVQVAFFRRCVEFIFLSLACHICNLGK